MGVKKSKNLRREQKIYELRRRSINALKYNDSFLDVLKWEAQINTQNFPRNSSITRSFRYCVITGRTKSIGRLYKISRQTFKRAATILPGIRKW